MRKMVDRSSELSVRSQCELLGIHRSGIYYENRGESALNLELMRLIDVRYHYHCYEGARRMHDYLKLDEGYEVSLNRVARLYYKVMGLRAIMPGPHTSKKNKEHKVYPYLLRGLTITRPNQVWATDITYIPMKKGYMYLIAIIDLHSKIADALEAQNAGSVDDTLIELERYTQSLAAGVLARHAEEKAR